MGGVPIDRKYRSSWSVIETHEGHSVWSKKDGRSGTIHGNIVGLHIESCIGCMKCVTSCPVNVFVSWISEDGAEVVDPILDADCILCLACELVCPTEAIHIDRQSGSQDTLDSLLRGA
ncbi:MAG: 4Fe-4S dicluster domain-containing protein [Candidatus Thorarchaeota archaeon]|jgi:NAD-dependent dihydropyrimidine dehydrogenase PreA subunit